MGGVFLGPFDPLQLVFNTLNTLMKKGLLTYDEARDILKSSLNPSMSDEEKEEVKVKTDLRLPWLLIRLRGLHVTIGFELVGFGLSTHLINSWVCLTYIASLTAVTVNSATSQIRTFSGNTRLIRADSASLRLI